MSPTGQRPRGAGGRVSTRRTRRFAGVRGRQDRRSLAVLHSAVAQLPGRAIVGRAERNYSAERRLLYEARELRDRLPRKSMLRLAVRAASGAVAGAAMLICPTPLASRPVRARASDAGRRIARRGATDAARNLQFSLKGGRLSVRAEPARNRYLGAAAALPPLPARPYNADAARGAVGWSLLLQPPPSASAARCELLRHARPTAARPRARIRGGDGDARRRRRGGAGRPLAAARQTPRAISRRPVCGSRRDRARRDQRGPRPATQAGGGAGGTPTERLEAMGVRVYGAGGRGATDGDDGGWSTLAGCDGVRAQLEESLVLPLQNPEVYREVMEGTRAKRRAPHAKAILLAGPPGTGKTSAARVLSSELGRPLVYLPLESVVSKWYGEAEQRLAAVFDAVAELGEAVIFLDEVDALATSRDGGTITRRRAARSRCSFGSSTASRRTRRPFPRRDQSAAGPRRRAHLAVRADGALPAAAAARARGHLRAVRPPPRPTTSPRSPPTPAARRAAIYATSVRRPNGAGRRSGSAARRAPSCRRPPSTVAACTSERQRRRPRRRAAAAAAVRAS